MFLGLLLINKFWICDVQSSYSKSLTENIRRTQIWNSDVKADTNKMARRTDCYNGPITARVARPVSNDRPFPDYDNFAREK